VVQRKKRRQKWEAGERGGLGGGKAEDGSILRRGGPPRRGGKKKLAKEKGIKRKNRMLSSRETKQSLRGKGPDYDGKDQSGTGTAASEKERVLISSKGVSFPVMKKRVTFVDGGDGNEGAKKIEMDMRFDQAVDAKCLSLRNVPRR